MGTRKSGQKRANSNGLACVFVVATIFFYQPEFDSRISKYSVMLMLQLRSE